MDRRLLAPGGTLVLALAIGAAACGDSSTGPEEGSTVMVAFRAEGTAAAIPARRSIPSDPPTTSTVKAAQAQEGTLELESVYLVVDEFKLEGNLDACEGPDPTPDCAKFEAEPHLLALPLLEGESEAWIEETAPPGTFTRLKFETKAATGNPDVQAAIDAEGIVDWPADASLMVTGSFTPDGASEGTSFRVFFDAEVKIVLPLPDPLVVTEEGDEEKVIVIVVAPEGWFLDEEGSVLDLTELDYDTSGQVQKLEVKLEDGFTKIELGG